MQLVALNLHNSTSMGNQSHINCLIILNLQMNSVRNPTSVYTLFFISSQENSTCQHNYYIKTPMQVKQFKKKIIIF